MKYIIILLFQFSLLCVSAQDTLYLKNGELQVVEIISVDVKKGIIIYKYNNQQSMRAISSLSRYTNHSSDEENVLPFIEEEPVQTMADLKSLALTPFVYGKFSIGFNALSLLSGLGKETEISIASNYNQSFYGHFNFNNYLAVRVPMRIGFSFLKDKNGNKVSYQYGESARNVIYEIGIEPLLMLNDRRQINPYLLPGIYSGLSQGARYTPNETNPGFETFIFGPREPYYRYAVNVGVQLNLKQHLAVNFEVGGNVNTARPWYYYPFERQKRVALQAAINLVYRFKAKDQ